MSPTEPGLEPRKIAPSAVIFGCAGALLKEAEREGSVALDYDEKRGNYRVRIIN